MPTAPRPILAPATHRPYLVALAHSLGFRPLVLTVADVAACIGDCWRAEGRPVPSPLPAWAGRLLASELGREATAAELAELDAAPKGAL